MSLPAGLGPRLAVALVALPMAAVLAAVAHGALGADPELWAHLRAHVLPRVIGNTALLVVGVTALSLVLGTGLAWLTAACDFPGRRFFTWALVLPMAMPAYVIAFVAIATLDYAGPVATQWRDWFGGDAALPPVRSTGGLIAVLGLALYPYVYLLARAAFLTHGVRVLEAARSLGLGPAQAFWRVALPLARPWLAAGGALVAMETLADFGAVSVFNYDTFTTAIYKSWFGLFSVETAMLLAVMLVAFVAVLVTLERLGRGRARYATAPSVSRSPERLKLRGAPAAVAFVAASTVLSLGFVVPAAVLLDWSVEIAPRDLGARYWGYLGRTLALAAMAAGACALLGLVLGYSLRREPGRGARAVARLATLGYAVPGAVLAVGVVAALGAIDRSWTTLTGSADLWLQGTVLALLLGYVARFLAVAHGPVEGALARLRPSLEEAARGLGERPLGVLARVHWPLLRAGIGTALLLVFVDVMKEMPITLMTRPFGWDTLAVRVFEMTAEGEWQRAALPSLVIAAAGLVPVILLTRRIESAARA